MDSSNCIDLNIEYTWLERTNFINIKFRTHVIRNRSLQLCQKNKISYYFEKSFQAYCDYIDWAGKTEGDFAWGAENASVHQCASSSGHEAECCEWCPERTFENPTRKTHFRYT